MRAGVEVSFRIALKVGSREIVVKDHNTDGTIRFVEIAVVGEIVGMLICSGWEPDLRLAFSLADGSPAPFSEQIAEAVKATLVRRYRLKSADISDYNMDPMVWACSKSSAAYERFESVLQKGRYLAQIGTEGSAGNSSEGDQRFRRKPITILR
jgi:hypothetical protein